MVLQRYISREVRRAVFFTLAAFLTLFAFFELLNQLDLVGYNGFKFQHALMYVVLGIPGYAYELMPTAVLIGSIFALSQLAARSEFTIMRASSMSTFMAGKMLARVGLALCIFTLVIGEFVSPKATEVGDRIKLDARGASLSTHFRSGMWAKDVVRTDGIRGDIVGTRFLNIGSMRLDGTLDNLVIYELDQDFHLATQINAARASYTGANQWLLADVNVISFPLVAGNKERKITDSVHQQQLESMKMVSEVTPDILNVLFADPDRMSAFGLYKYINHLELNNQRTERYEIALWKKIIYPLSVFVMMALALPFAYLHFRAGGVSLKIFVGIMVGVSFQLFSMLFSHIGMLHAWPPFLAAGMPSLLYLLIAILALIRVERR